jgi:sodium-dependent dicarboxylate transporter 2/3/5
MTTTKSKQKLPIRPHRGGRIAGVFGFSLFLLALLVPVGGLPDQQRIILGTSLWMAVWWISGTAPLYVTAFIPLLVFPLVGISSFAQTASSYGDRLVFLLMGGFMLAKAIEKTGLHERFALLTLAALPVRSPAMIITAFMVVTASVSAWICNTATTLMVLPIALAVISQVSEENGRKHFGACLMLAVAYAAGIGGITTLIGTPPNALCASIAGKMFDIDLSFARWIMVGLPVMLTCLLITAWYLTKVAFPMSSVSVIEGKDVIEQRLALLGKMTRDQKWVLAVFAFAAIAWITHLGWKAYLPDVDDAMIAIFAASLLFILPSSVPGKRILEEKEGMSLPWGVLLVIGGGISLAAGIQASGLDTTIAQTLGFLQGMPMYVVMLAVFVAAASLTQIVVNTASAAILLPIAASLAQLIDADPLLLLIPVAVGTSFAFILPIGTPPNTVVIGSGYLTPAQMARTGLPLTVLLVAVVSVLLYILIPLVSGSQ